MSCKLRCWMGKMFSVVFLVLSLGLVGLAVSQVHDDLGAGKELISIFVQSINTVIIALAIFELGIGIGKEYAQPDDESNTYYVVRRTITRFVGTVCIALVLEGLIMIIKYSQLELAGNLYYPVGILVGAGVLLACMGLFLHLTRPDCTEHTEGTAAHPPIGRLDKERNQRRYPGRTEIPRKQA